MINAFVRLDIFDVGLAALLLLAHGLVSVVYRLGLGRKIVVAGLRMVVQLLLLGLVLQYLFALNAPAWTVLLIIIMVLFAGREATARQKYRFTGLWGFAFGTGAMAAASILVTGFALVTQFRPDPWYDPRFVIPLLGMVLGNSLNGVSLGLMRLGEAAHDMRPAIEARLAVGGTRNQAFAPAMRVAMQNGLAPVLNSMSACGIVFIPGMMTGQILAGIDPLQAVLYQLLLMFLIAGATGLGVWLAVRCGVWRLSDPRHRLRLDRLKAR
jgi:putative ABC transport system permease protein|tara:strand:- start:4409 stop:5212 length:804 start_codon:yes stop_codon:yes gene_type:complete